MNQRLSILFLILLTYADLYSQSQPIGLGWAQNSINTVIFRRNSVVSHKGIQYAAYYDPEGNVMLAKRSIGNNNWELERTKYSGNIEDAHNSISIMVDGDGYLHMAWDHHGEKLNYSKSVEPGSLKLSRKLNMINNREKSVTYPEFYKLPNGDLIFLYRDGSSGRGNLIINQYDLKSKSWTRLHNTLIDGEDQRNAYWQAYIDAQGTIHISWVWRETGDVGTNHDICYAKSTDFGKTWQKSTGELYTIPISAATAEYVRKIPQNSELINSTTKYADTSWNPYIATYFRPQGSPVTQYHIIYTCNSGWQTKIITDRKTPFTLRGGGTKKIPISRPQIVVNDDNSVILIYRDEEHNNRITIRQRKYPNLDIWEVYNVGDFSVGSWEPSYDTELWRNSKKLHLFVQKSGQGDGEKLESIPPQPVYIYEVPIR